MNHSRARGDVGRLLRLTGFREEKPNPRFEGFNYAATQSTVEITAVLEICSGDVEDTDESVMSTVCSPTRNPFLSYEDTAVCTCRLCFPSLR